MQAPSVDRVLRLLRAVLFVEAAAFLHWQRSGAVVEWEILANGQ